MADGEVDVARDDAGLFVVTRGVTGELEEFGDEVLKHSGEIDCAGRGVGNPSAWKVTEPVDGEPRSTGQAKSAKAYSARLRRCASCS